MEENSKKRIESAAWDNPAPDNEQNDNAPKSNNTIKVGGNSRAAEDDIDLNEQLYKGVSKGDNKSDNNAGENSTGPANKFTED